MAFLLLILLSAASSQEVSTPANLLGPRNYNYHAYRYLEDPEPTKKGPILFPNDAPPPPRPPLIVTARPLTESIARSELNNSIASSSQINPEFRLKPNFLKPEFRLKPEYRKPDYLKGFLSRIKDYRPFVLPTPAADYAAYDGRKSVLDDIGDNGYGDYTVQTPLPPIYKVLADHAKQKVLKLKHNPLEPAHHDYQVKEPDYSHRYQHNDVRDDGEADYDHASNYAFSYTVKDQKTGDDFSHSQHSTGSSTNGEYRVRLPDGRMQIVSYTADHNGYKADVRYDDEDKTSGNRIDDNHDYKQKPDYKNTLDYRTNDYKHDYDENDYDKHNDYKSNPYDYVVSRDYKPVASKDSYNQYTDLSKEYNSDYSLEYDGKDDNYSPHRSKFSSFVPKSSNLGTIIVPTERQLNSVSSTVRPSYEELKHLFVNKPTQNYYKNVEINVPSTTPNTFNFDQTTEHVVVIGKTNPNLYTNIRNVPLTATPSPVSTSNFVTPRSYLVSTIASLAKGEKPVLSDSFINRINKYLTFT
ncbi:uncharacterized protein LOC126378099 [Pectinophora gossypiella]|uniref:uncharacterized protein LOC126378099 n=1 Tax=Pectinophora gossypiella TaxID=13191 RepID=UPI00214F43C7|nr:uncharacterized protein LOC126378099 [Pectinophora gossypiella]